MKYIVHMMLALCAATTVLAEDQPVSGKTHTFTVPGDVTSRPAGDSAVYSFQWKSGVGTAIHVVHVTSSASSPEQLESQADAMQLGLEEQFKKEAQFTDIKKNTRVIELGTFKGMELAFILKHQSGVPLWHHHFFLSDGKDTLRGQLSAHTKNDREKACAIMKSAKRRMDGAKKKPSEVPHPGGMAHYAKLVVVNTQQANGQVKVTCTLPELQMGKILYKAKSVSVNEANKKKPIATTQGTSKVTFSAPEEQLPSITLDATYIDARSFSEKTRDPDKRVDWNVRFLQFKLSDILKDGYRNNK